MKVKDLIAVNTADTWITFDEDPNTGEPNIVVRSHSRVDESEMLAKELLEAEGVAVRDDFTVDLERYLWDGK